MYHTAAPRPVCTSQRQESEIWIEPELEIRVQFRSSSDGMHYDCIVGKKPVPDLNPLNVLCKPTCEG